MASGMRRPKAARTAACSWTNAAIPGGTRSGTAGLEAAAIRAGWRAASRCGRSASHGSATCCGMPPTKPAAAIPVSATRKANPATAGGTHDRFADTAACRLAIPVQAAVIRCACDSLATFPGCSFANTRALRNDRLSVGGSRLLFHRRRSRTRPDPGFANSICLWSIHRVLVRLNAAVVCNELLVAL